VGDGGAFNSAAIVDVPQSFILYFLLYVHEQLVLSLDGHYFYIYIVEFPHFDSQLLVVVPLVHHHHDHGQHVAHFLVFDQFIAFLVAELKQNFPWF
jgi:hypothetical protein